MMRVYAVADIHGKPARMAEIQGIMSELQPSALVVAGDITGYFNPEAVINRLNQLPAPVMAVRGNSDMKKVDRLLDFYPNTSSLHLSVQHLGGIDFIGISGTIPVPFSTRISWQEKKILSALTAMVADDSVLVAHPPPRGLLDMAFGKFHAGCRGLQHLVERCRPRLVLCGHIHECPGIVSTGQTTVVNCSVARHGRGAVVNFNTEGSFRVEML
jgi:Icc-related predicted phosphoesterase